MTDKQTEPTITIPEVMAETGVKDRSSVNYRIRKGDFRRAGRNKIYNDDQAEVTMAIMSMSRAKNAGRPKKG